MTPSTPVERIIAILQEAEYQPLSMPLTVASVPFDFAAALVGTGKAPDLIVVLDAVVEAEVRLRQKVDGLARALDVAGSRRPLTAVIFGPKPSDTTLEMLGRVCRVLPVGTPTGSTAEQELRDWLAVLMPLPLADSHGAIADPPGELKKALPADLDEEVRAPLLASASGGARAVQRALRDLLSAPLAGIDMTSEDGA